MSVDNSALFLQLIFVVRGLNNYKDFYHNFMIHLTICQNKRSRADIDGNILTADIDIECKAIVNVLLLRVSRMAKDQLTFFKSDLCVIFASLHSIEW